MSAFGLNVVTLLACYASAGPTFVVGPPATATVGYLVPISQTGIAAGPIPSFGAPGSANFAPDVTTNTLVSSTAVAGVVGPEIKFRVPLSMGGQTATRRFRASCSWVTSVAGGAASTARIRAHIRVLDAAGTVVATLTAAGGLTGVTRAADAATTYKDFFEPVTVDDFAPNAGLQLEIGFQLEIVNAVAGNVTWRIANGLSSAGVTGVEIDALGI